MADRFPDGQLFVNLRGYDSDRAVEPEAALAGFLRALGVDGRDIAHELAERAAQYRTLLHDRRMLVVLDNAYAEEQVRPLLPGSGSCSVVVTSRDRLAGLAARDGARRVNLDAFTQREAIALLRTLVGARVDTDPQAAAALVEQCERLPLVLRIAAELVAERPGASLADLVRELADERRRLDLFDAGADRRSAVRTVFWWSYRRLPTEEARTFRLLGLYPGADIDSYAVAALIGADLAASRRRLDVLIRAHLVQECTPGRYRMHDLMRAYAAERADEEPEPDRPAALTRLLHHYLSTAAEVMDVLYPAERRNRPRGEAHASPAPPVKTEELARAWLDVERANLVAATVLAAENGMPTQAGDLAAMVQDSLASGAYFSDAMTVNEYALRAARQHRDRHRAARACLGLGGTCMQLGRFDGAASYFRQALAGYRDIGDSVGVARALGNIGWVHAEQGRYAEALDHYQQSLAGHRANGDRLGEATTLGWVGLELGRLTRYEEAIDHLQRAISACREIHYPMREVEALSDLGQVLIWAGRYDEATQPTRQALTITREKDNRLHEADLLNNLAECLAATDRPGEALVQYRLALAQAGAAGQRHVQARALTGIADILLATGHPEEARQHWQEALDHYTALKMPSAEDVRTRLAGLDSPPN